MGDGPRTPVGWSGTFTTALRRWQPVTLAVPEDGGQREYQGNGDHDAHPERVQRGGAHSTHASGRIGVQLAAGTGRTYTY